MLKLACYETRDALENDPWYKMLKAQYQFNEVGKRISEFVSRVWEGVKEAVSNAVKAISQFLSSEWDSMLNTKEIRRVAHLAKHAKKRRARKKNEKRLRELYGPIWGVLNG